MESTNNLPPQEAKWVASKNAKDQRKARLAELKANIVELEAECQKIKTVAPEAQALIDQWTGNVQELKQRFIHGLAARSAEGKIPVISFGSAEALAFLNADRWISAFPELAEQVSGRKGTSSAASKIHMQIINDELLVLRSEYSALGGL